MTSRVDELYKIGRSYVSKAISLDEKKMHVDAVSNYEKGCRYLLEGIKLDRDKKRRRIAISSLNTYVSRAESIAKEPNHSQGSKFQEKNLKSVIGMSQVKQTLREAIVLPMIHPQLFDKNRKPWNGILLYGPPGTGKSRCVEAIAADAKCNFYSISSADIVSKHQGESEKAIKSLFQNARKSTPCIIFLDEIDSIGGERGENESSRRILTELLKQMDGVGSENDGITVLAATNHPDSLDSALRRRFQMRLYVPLPGPGSRTKILKLHLGDDPQTVNLSNEDIEKIASKMDMYTGSDLAAVANEALMSPVRRCLRSSYFRVVPENNINEKKGWSLTGLFRTVSSVIGLTYLEVPPGHVVVPCSVQDPGAVKISMLDENFPCEKLRTPAVTKEDLESAINKIKPTVNQDMVNSYKEFAERFGSKLENNGVDCEESDSEDDNKITDASKKRVYNLQENNSSKRVLVAG